MPHKRQGAAQSLPQHSSEKSLPEWGMHIESHGITPVDSEILPQVLVYSYAVLAASTPVAHTPSIESLVVSKQQILIKVQACPPGALTCF